MGKTWRQKIDAQLAKKMQEAGFQTTQFEWIFKCALTEEIEFVVSIKQTPRQFPAQASMRFLTLVGVMHPQLCSLSNCLKLDWQQSRCISPANYSTGNWIVRNNFEQLGGKGDWVLNDESSPEDIAAVIEDLIQKIKEIGQPFARQFDSLDKLLKDMLMPDAMRGRACEVKEFKIVAAQILLGRYDDALAYLDAVQADIQNGKCFLNKETFAHFKQNSQAAIFKRRAQ